MMMAHLPTAPVLDTFCPMHLSISASGHITHVGPTLRKLRPGALWIGERFLEIFDVSRPRAASTMADLARHHGRKIHLELRGPDRISLTGIAVSDGSGGTLLNVAFGISTLRAVQRFALTHADFAPTDPTIEMLYIVEAKSAAMSAIRDLNRRLQGDKLQAEEEALTDTLTGLRNRRALEQHLARLLSSRTPLTLLHIDLDHFKAVNDEHGHTAGDAVLRKVAQIFRRTLRSRDFMARVGGDEFVVVVPNTQERDVIEDLGTRLIEAIETPMAYKDRELKISSSIGTVLWNGSVPTTYEDLIERADEALYSSKRGGRGRQSFRALDTAYPADEASGEHPE